MLALGERGGNPVRIAEGHLYRGLLQMHLADFSRAREQLVEALNRYQRPHASDHFYEGHRARRTDGGRRAVSGYW